MSSKKNSVINLTAAGAALLTVLVYLPALKNGFVNWDDVAYVYENPYIRTIDPAFFKWAFTTYYFSYWHPVTWISHAVDVRLWGLNPSGHHFTNILIHGCNTFLTVMIAGRLIDHVTLKKVPPLTGENRNNGHTFSVIASLTAGLLFGLHPLHVESVAWASERKDVLYSLFFLLSLFFYIKYAASFSMSGPHSGVKGKRALHYLLCLALFVLSLMSKPMAVTLPVVLIILDIYPFERSSFMAVFTTGRRILIEKLPFVLLSLAISAFTLKAQKSSGALVHIKPQLLGENLLIASRTLLFYLQKMVWPSDLAPFYPYPSAISFLSLEYTGSVIILALITAFCFYVRKKQKMYLAIWVYYLVTLAPVIRIIQVGEQAAADRYTYLPSLGPFLLAGLGTALLYQRIRDRAGTSALLKRLFFLPLILIMIVVSSLTIRQIQIWKDSFTLWSAEKRIYPDAYISYKNLGEAYGKSGDYERSLIELNTSLKLNPLDAETYANRGIALGKSGRHLEAIEDLKRSLNLDPTNHKTYDDLGVAHAFLGRYEEAAADFSNSIETAPDYANAYFHRGIAYKNMGLEQSAIRDFQSAARLGHNKAREYLKITGIVW